MTQVRLKLTTRTMAPTTSVMPSQRGLVIRNTLTEVLRQRGVYWGSLTFRAALMLFQGQDT